MQRFCGKCGCRIEEGGAFCASCGAPVRPWTVEDEQAWRRATGRVPVPNPGNGPEPASKPAPESPKLVINTKKESPEFENYFDTPGDL